MAKIDKNVVIQLHNKGFTNKQICEYFDAHIQYIYKVIRDLKLVPNKKSNYIKNVSHEESQILIGTILGDATLVRKNINSQTYGSITHGVKQKEYIEWKQDKLKRFSSNIRFREHYHKIRKVMEYNYSFSINANKCLNEYYHLFYNENKKKKLNYKIIELLEPLGLAVWFMDDGSKTNSGGYYLHTNSFSKENQEEIIILLEEKFKLKINLHKTTKKANIMYISARSAKQFERIISPFIIESMKYKLHNKVYKYNMIEIENNNHFTTYRGVGKI